MLRGLALFIALPIFGANVQLLTLLPNGATTNAIQLDGAGNIYVAGTYPPANIVDTSDAFVAKVSADGSQVLYFTALSGLTTDIASALAVGPDGSAYVAGYTSSPDFPVTPGAYQTTNNGGGTQEGFLTKLNPSGAISYSTFLNGPSTIAGANITGVTLDSAGDVFLTGIGGPAQPANPTGPPQGFILKFDPTMTKVLMSEYGYGGGLMQLDSQGNIYVAGSQQATATGSNTGFTFTLPPFAAGAFQATQTGRFCETFGGGPGGIGGSVPCRYQYVAKLDPTGKLIWGTYVSGSSGAIVRGMAVDSSGNLIVAGTTLSDDYPVTSGAFQTAYTASAPPYPNTSGNGYVPPPNTIGFVSKVNSTGTNLLWSTYFGGSFADEINGLAVNSTGEIFVSGRAASSDLPGLEDLPDGCHPSPVQILGFVARLSYDGATAGPAQIISGAPDCSYLTCDINSDYPSFTASWPLAIRSNGTLIIAGTAGTLASVDFSATSRLACVTDPADNVQLRTVAPGQLVSLFGNDLAPVAPLTPSGGVQASTANLGITFNGTGAPILYASGQQINIQVPYEIAGQSTVQMQLSDNQVNSPVSEGHTLGVVSRQPSILLSPTAWQSPFTGYVACNGAEEIGEPAFALNADGTVNSCSNPAALGSTVTVFVNGLGQGTPALSTGAIEPSPAVPQTPVSFAAGLNLNGITTTTTTVPGAISGIAQVQFQVPASAAGDVYQIVPSLQGTVMHERLVLVWIR